MSFVGPMLLAQPFEVGAKGYVVLMAPQKFLKFRAGEKEQRAVDEVNGRGGAFDVQQNGANYSFVERAAQVQFSAWARGGWGGIYAGPRQSGWCWRSTPLAV